MDQAIYAGLQDSPYQIELYNESLETTLFSDDASQRELRDSYLRKYEHRKPDVIIAVGPASLKFMIDTHERSFPNIPIIFCGGTEEMLGQLKLDSHFTGAWGVADPEETLNVALRLQPSTRNLVVVGGVGPFDRDVVNIVRQSLRKYESRLEFTYLTDLDMPTILDRLRQLPSNTIVFHTSIMQDAAGARFIDATQSIPMVAKAANAPVFAIDDVDVGTGAVGGYVLSWAAQGRVAAQMAVRVLNGESPQSIPVTKTPNVYLFDWRALRRWGLNEKDLPPGNRLLNRETGVWDSYKWYIVGGVSLILAEALLILEMLWLRERRRKIESALAKSEEKFSKAFRQSPLSLTIKTAKDSRYIDVNETFEQITGRTREEIIGRTPKDIEFWDEPEVATDIGRRLLSGDIVRNLELKARAKSGETRSTLESAELIEIAGEPCVLAVKADITDLKRAETALREREELFRLAMNNVAAGLYTLDLQGLVTYVNPAAESMFMWTHAELLGKKMHDVTHYLHPDGTPFPACDCPGLRILQEGIEVREREDVFIRKDGSFFPVVFSASPLKREGKTVGIVVGFRDDTMRREAARAMRESEERFRLVANTAPVMIWMSGIDKLCTYFNRPWLEFSGRSLEQEVRNGWAEGVHPEDLSRCLDTYTTAFDRREPFQMEYRLRRSDGEYRWIINSGVPRFNADASFNGYIGSAMDITDRKLAAEALSTVSRKLIEAHEEERAWLARELHDDINQRLCVLAMSLGSLRNDANTSRVEFKQGIGQAVKEVSNLASDLQALSHRLHSSKLEFLGLAAAVAGFCSELADQHKVEIDLHSENIPRDLSPEIALSIFRVLQEALQNAIKHSGSLRFEVSLSCGSNEIELTVRDSGKGFDAVEAMKGRGLGLTSMKERVALVNGELSIESQRQIGTTIHLRVPLVSKTSSALAG
jgi:PAS domain S-box-containing protein